MMTQIGMSLCDNERQICKYLKVILGGFSLTCHCRDGGHRELIKVPSECSNASATVPVFNLRRVWSPHMHLSWFEWNFITILHLSHLSQNWLETEANMNYYHYNFIVNLFELWSYTREKFVSDVFSPYRYTFCSRVWES